MGAISETAKLIASLTLKDGLTPVVRTIGGSLDELDARLDKTQGRAFLAGQQIGTGIKNGLKVATVATVAAASAFTALFIKSVGKASDLSETISKVGVVFKDNAQQILDFGKTAAAGLGLSENAALSAAAVYGNLFVSMGLTAKQSATMSQRLVTLAGDLASFNNIDPTEAADKLRAGITGESEPLKELGININETIIKQKALELGLVKLNITNSNAAKSTAQLRLERIELTKAQKAAADAAKKFGPDDERALKLRVAADKAEKKVVGTVKSGTIPVLTAAQKAQAAYALILEQSTTAQGDFGRTSDGLANQTRILKANWENLQTSLARSALPGVAKIMKRINDLVTANQPAIAKLGDQIGDLFSDQNIATGARIITDVFNAAKDAAPTLVLAAEKMGAVIKTGVDLFRSLPPEIQSLAVAGLAINKLTGGLVTNLAGGLISAVISSFKGLMNVNAAIVNVNGAVTGPGLLPNLAADAAGAAGAAGAVGTVPALALIAASVGATVIGSAQVRGAIDQAIVQHDIPMLQRAAEEARKRGVSDSNNAALQALLKIVHNTDALTAGVTPFANPSQDAAEKAQQQRNSVFTSVPTRNELRARIAQNTEELKKAPPATARHLKALIKSDQDRLAKRIADQEKKVKDAVDAASRAIVRAVQIAAPALQVTVPVTTQTIIDGRLVTANFSRYTSVIGGRVVNATSGSGV